MSGPFSERHRRTGLATLALVEARLRGDDQAVEVLARPEDPADYAPMLAAAVELLAQTLTFRMSGDGPYRQVQVWRESLLRRPTPEEETPE